MSKLKYKEEKIINVKIHDYGDFGDCLVKYDYNPANLHIALTELFKCIIESHGEETITHALESAKANERVLGEYGFTDNLSKGYKYKREIEKY